MAQLTSVDIWTCSLHVIHGAFETAIESCNWEIKNFLKGNIQLLHDSSAIRTGYSIVQVWAYFPCTVLSQDVLTLIEVKLVEKKNKNFLEISPFQK